MPVERILIVEDEKLVAEDIRLILEKFGYNICGIESSGEEAIKTSLEVLPDLILMDILLKGELNGIETVREIHKKIFIPVIYISAYTDYEILEKAKKTDPYGYLTKPFDINILKITIEMALYKSRTEKLLKEREAWYLTTLKSVGDAIITTDNYGRLNFMNRPAEEITGWRVRDAYGKDLEKIYIIVDENTYKPIASPFNRIYEGQATPGISNDKILLNKHGEKIPIEDSASPIKDDEGKLQGIVIVFHNISKRRKGELKTQRKLEFEKVISSISNRFVGVFDLDASIEDSLNKIGKIIGASRSYMFTINEDEETTTNTHEWCSEGVTPQKENLQNIPLNVIPWWITRLREDGKIHIPDVSQLPPEAISEKKILESQNIKSLLTLAIYVKEKIYGFIGFDNIQTSGSWSKYDFQILRIFSEIISNTLSRKEAEEALVRSEKDYRMLFENAQDAIIIFRPEDELILDVNPRACEIYGLSKSEFVGSSMEKFSKNIARGKIRIQETMNNGRVENFQTIHYKNTSEEMDVDIHGSIIDFKGHKAILTINRDITEQKKAEKSIKKYTEELKQLNASKDKFFSIIAHDLKSPFLGILGSMQYMKESMPELNASPELMTLVENSDNSLKNTFSLLENLLEWSQVQIGRKEFVPVNFDISFAIAQVIELVMNIASKKKIKIVSKLNSKIEVFADLNMVNSILRNLISNAIKFSNKNGNVIIDFEIVDSSLTISVEDNGIGIEEDTIKKLFNIETPFSTRGTSKEKGTGLGLILCREFVEQNSGKIWVESQTGKGTTFYFTLPLSFPE